MRKLFGLILGLILITACAASSLAQDQDKTKSAKTRTVTGCVSKGDSPDEYKLTVKDGSTWELRSNTEAMSNASGKSVNLAEHVGHTVTVIGTVEKAKMEMKEGEKHEAKEGGMKHEHGSEPRELKVISLKHVSGSCS